MQPEETQTDVILSGHTITHVQRAAGWLEHASGPFPTVGANGKHEKTNNGSVISIGR